MDHNYLKYRELKNNDIILILGAYDGDFIREKKDEIIEKNVFVINIEPDIRLCRKMMEFIQKEIPLNATALNMAVSDKTGVSIFKNCNNHLTSGLKDIPSIWPEDTEFETKILMVKLDDLISMYNINCIFCDIEGAELEVFGESFLFTEIDYIAIASYHLRDGVKTYINLSSYFKRILSPGRNVQIDSGDNNEEVLYII